MFMRIAIVMIPFVCAAYAASEPPFQWNVRDWEEIGPEAKVTTAGSSQAALTVEGRQDTPGKALLLRYAFTPEETGGVTLQAEEAVHAGMTPYPDPDALGGTALGEFGETAGDYVEFRDVPATDQVNFHYNNGTGAPKQASLYVNGEDVATLVFEDTGGWFSEFAAASYEGPVEGTVRLQVDADDLAANEVFCCNVDAMSTGPVPERAQVTLHVPLAEPLSPETQSISLEVKELPHTFKLGLRRADGTAHWSVGLNHRAGKDWARYTLLLRDLEPPVPAGARTDVQSLMLAFKGDGLAAEGATGVDDVIASRGWPSTPPANCPLEPSADFQGIALTGRHANYTRADTWYPSWASDGKLYSPYTDGFVSDVFVRSDNADATTGMGLVEGDDPMDLEVSDIGFYTSRPWPYITRYPCGTLVHDGVWYYGTYILNGDGRPAGEDTMLGPFVGFRTSTDFGTTWTETPCRPLNNLFGEAVYEIPEGYTKIKMGSPHFVDFGQNMEHSPDGKAYLLAHGSTDPTARQTWILGDHIYLVRVTPSIANINDISAYEFFAGHDSNGEPVWADDFDDIRPLIDWPGRTGCVTATYMPGLGKYVMCVSVGRSVAQSFDTYVLEADTLTGPWRLVTYMNQFGTQAYFVNIPSKFISEDGKRAWLCYAANWTGHAPSPRSSAYAMSLHEFTLEGR